MSGKYVIAVSDIAAFWDGIQPRERPAAGLATAENSPASSEKVLATLEKRHETSILAVKTSRSCPRLTVCALYMYSRLCPGEDSTPYMCMLLCPRLKGVYCIGHKLISEDRGV